jgi:antitoxin FitA
MTAINIPLSDEKRARLQSLADRVGLSAEEFLRRRVEQLLDRPDAAFCEAAEYVLHKNAELYRRLS